MVDAAAPRDAATVIMLRDAQDGLGLETLLLRRHNKAGFAADAWVFPGGVVDAADAALPAHRWTGIDPHGLADRFGVSPDQVLAFYVAAVREAFEESGLLLAHHTDGSPPDLTDPELMQLRHDLADRTTTVDFAGWLEAQDLILDLGEMTYLSHWVTPTIEPRRYDARFFVARAPRDQLAVHDRLEVTDQRWISPAAALAESKAGEMQLIYPTVKTLQSLVEHDSVEAVVQFARAQPTIRRLLPHAVLDDEGRLLKILHPDHPDYPAA